MKCRIMLFVMFSLVLGANVTTADLVFNRSGDWSASTAGSDPNGHGTVWDAGSLSWTYYTLALEPSDATVYPGTEYSPSGLDRIKYRADTGSFYEPYEAAQPPVYAFETKGLNDRLYVYWNSTQYQSYGKQQWCIAVFTNPFDFDILVDLSGASEIQTAQRGHLDGTKVEIAKINADFDAKTVLWSYEFPAGSPYINTGQYPWIGWVTSYIFDDFMLESVLQAITLAPGESLAFGLRVGYREAGVDVLDPENQFLYTSWVDEGVTLNVSASENLTIAIETNPAGNEGATSGAGSYLLGETVSISASDFPDCANGVVYKFDHWEGDVDNSGSVSTTVTMSNDTTVTAVYNATAECGDACHPVPEGSFDGDCYVGLEDLDVMVSQWLTSSL